MVAGVAGLILFVIIIFILWQILSRTPIKGYALPKLTLIALGIACLVGGFILRTNENMWQYATAAFVVGALLIFGGIFWGIGGVVPAINRMALPFGLPSVLLLGVLFIIVPIAGGPIALFLKISLGIAFFTNTILALIQGLTFAAGLYQSMADLMKTLQVFTTVFFAFWIIFFLGQSLLPVIGKTVAPSKKYGFQTTRQDMIPVGTKVPAGEQIILVTPKGQIPTAFPKDYTVPPGILAYRTPVTKQWEDTISGVKGTRKAAGGIIEGTAGVSKFSGGLTEKLQALVTGNITGGLVSALDFSVWSMLVAFLILDLAKRLILVKVFSVAGTTTAFGVVNLGIFALSAISSYKKPLWNALLLQGIYIGLGWLFLSVFSLQLGNIDTYLNFLNGLRFVGVPDTTIDSMKSGIRGFLETLNFNLPIKQKPTPTVTNEFLAPKVKFGSKFRDFKLPTLFGGDPTGYSLPVLVSNPNIIENNVVIKDFDIDDLGVVQGGTISQDANAQAQIDAKEKLLCGRISETASPYNIPALLPQSEQQMAIDFKQDASCILQDNVLSSQTLSVDTEPDGTRICSETCRVTHRTAYPQGAIEPYNSADSGMDKLVQYKYTHDNKLCECWLNLPRSNEFKLLCEKDLFGETAKARIMTSYNMVSRGKGEVRISTEDSLKLIPPLQTSQSLGPLQVSLFFVPDPATIKASATSVTVKMFFAVSNEGGGRAELNAWSSDGSKSGLVLKDSNDRSLSMVTCEKLFWEKLKYLNKGEEREIPCDVPITPGTVTTYVTKTFTFEVRYKYVKEEYVALQINQATGEQGGFCTTACSEVKSEFECNGRIDCTWSGSVCAIKVPCSQLKSQADCTKRSADCTWVPPVGTGAGSCTTR